MTTNRERVTWDKIWIDFALNLSRRSADPKHQVGAVIVSLDNRYVLGVGYNGDEDGGSNIRTSMESGKSGFIHAEVNAIMKMNPFTEVGRKIYCTMQPCEVCAKAIINARISSVTYLESYAGMGPEILRRAGVEVNYLNEVMD